MPTDRAAPRGERGRQLRRLLLIALVVAAAVLSWLLAFWRVEPEQHPSAPVVASAAEGETLAAPAEPAAPRLPRGAKAPAEPALQPAELTAAAPEPPATPPPEQPPEPPVVGHPMELERLQPPSPMGPAAQLARRFAGESEVAGARQREKEITALFDDPNVDPDMLESVLCRRSVCRVVLEWIPVRTVGSLVALAHLRRNYPPDIGIAPAAPPNKEGARRIEVYVDLDERAREN